MSTPSNLPYNDEKISYLHIFIGAFSTTHCRYLLAKFSWYFQYMRRRLLINDSGSPIKLHLVRAVCLSCFLRNLSLFNLFCREDSEHSVTDITTL